MATDDRSWIVKKISLSPRAQFYVQGTNTLTTNPLDQNFYWHIGVESLKGYSNRYDLTYAEIGEGVVERLARLGWKIEGGLFVQA